MGWRSDLGRGDGQVGIRLTIGRPADFDTLAGVVDDLATDEMASGERHGGGVEITHV